MSLVVPFEEIFKEDCGLLAKHPTWEKVELNLISAVQNGYAFKSSLFSTEQGFPLIRIRDLENNCTKTYYNGDFPDEYVVDNDDILIGMDGIFRAQLWSGGKALLNQRVCRLLPAERYVNKRFLFYIIQGYLTAIQKATSSVTVGHLSSRDILRIPIPLPPLNEQNRIVVKLDKLLAKVETARECLDKIPGILKKYRQAILISAFSGQLTLDWRETNQNKIKDDPSVLLKKIKHFRLENSKSKREFNQINKLYEQLCETKSSFQDENTFPEEWETCTIFEVGNVYNGSTPSRKRKDYWDGNINWISSGEVNNNIIYNTREKITKKGFENSSVKLFPKGTVLIAMIGEGKTRGQAAILEIESTCNQNVAGVLLDHGFVDSKYLFYWFLLKYQKHRNLGSGSGPKALNCQRVREMDFVLPPLEEQKEIVNRVEKLLSKADEIEKRYKKAKEYVDKLNQSILAKAFRGEFVPQDPNDEPASKLLEKIIGENNNSRKN